MAPPRTPIALAALCCCLLLAAVTAVDAAGGGGGSTFVKMQDTSELLWVLGVEGSGGR